MPAQDDSSVWLGGEALMPFGARVVYIATNLLEGSLAVLHAVIPAVRHRNLAYLFEFTERRMVRFQQVVDQSSMGIGEGGQASKLCREKGRGVVDPPLQLPASSCALTVGRETVLSAEV